MTSEIISALKFSEAIAALREPALDLAAEEKRRAQMKHARQIDRAAAWDRQAQVRPAPATLARLAERMRERAFERVVGPPLHQLATQVAGATTVMRAAYGRLLDATRLREGPEVAATHIQAVAGRKHPRAKAAPRLQPAQRGPVPGR